MCACVHITQQCYFHPLWTAIYSFCRNKTDADDYTVDENFENVL